MSFSFGLSTPLPVLCQSLLQGALALWLQSALLVLAGLAAGYALRRRGGGAAGASGGGPALPWLLYRATFLAVLLCGLLSVALAPTHRSPLLQGLSLPPAQELPVGPGQLPAVAEGAGPQVAAQGAAPLTGRPVRDAQGQPVTVLVTPPPDPLTATSPVSAAWPAPRFRDFLMPQMPPLRTSAMGWLYVGVVGLWLGGTLWLLCWLLLGYAGIGRMRRRSAPVAHEAALSLLEDLCARQRVRAPQLRASPDVRGVFLVGLWRPAIVLPATYRTDFDDPTLRAVLAHEVAHLAGRDPAWTLLTRLLCAALWTQPLLWVLRRDWEQASEEVCDLAALPCALSPRAYAECLLRLAERLSPSRLERTAGIGVVLSRSSLGRRLQRLLGYGSSPSLSLPLRVRAVVTLGAVSAIALAAFLIPAAATVAKQPPPLGRDALATAGDPRLEQRVAVTAEGIAVGELLPLLSQKTGLTLVASRTLADEKVIVLGPARPLSQILSDLAALLGAYWEREQIAGGKGRYVLAQRIRTRQYEERLARASQARLLAELEAQVRALTESPEQLAQRPEDDPIRKALSDPQSRVATQLFALLGLKQRENLLEEWRVRLPVSALSERQKDQIEHLFHGERFKPELHGGIEITQIPRAQMDRHAITFQIHNAGGEYRQSGLQRVSLSAPTGFDIPLTTFHATAKFVLPAHGDPYTGEAVTQASAVPDAKVVRSLAAAGGWPDTLRRIAEKTGQPVLSDYYRSKPINVAAEGDEAISPETPAGALALDALCRPTGYLWWTRGRTLLFRKRDWYTQRLYEVPDRWVLALQERLAAQKGAPSIADMVRLRELSLSQIVGLNESMGQSTSKHNLAGLRDLLAAVEACPVDTSAPVFSGVLGGAVSYREAAILPDLSDPRQSALVNAFLQAFHRDLSSYSEIGFIFHHSKRDNRKDKGQSGSAGRPLPAVQVGVHLYLGNNTMGAGYLLSLPLALPDDRRDKTRIELKPD